MGKPPRGGSTRAATLTALPQDVLLHILDLMTPAQIAIYSQLCRLTAASATDPSIWASLARRHLGIAPPHSNSLDAKEVSRLATSLVCRWWLVTGAFVPGVPVHFRKGFAQTTARGGVELPVDPDGSVSAYVIGGTHKDAAIPVAVPGVTMDFFLDAAGPFPMDGMRIRIVHASEPTHLPANADSSPAPPIATLNLSITDLVSDPSPSETASSTPESDRARVRVKVNNATVVDCCSPDPLEFSVLDISVAPDLLLTKPRMNTLVVEYDRSCTAAYWLKEVTVVPDILPMPPVPEESLRFVVSEHAPKQPQPAARPVFLPRVQLRQESRENRERVPPPPPPPPPRRTVRHDPLQSPKYRVVEAKAGGRQNKGAKLLKQAKKPKHYYHHNHYRSPRGPAPGSPRSRSGR